MKARLAPPFQAIDMALAERILDWHQSTDLLLWQTAAATSFALQQGHSCLYPRACLQQAPYNEMEALGGVAFPPAEQWLQQLQSFGLAPDSLSPLIVDNERIYLRRYWCFENTIAWFFNHRANHSQPLGDGQREIAQRVIQSLFPSGSQASEKPGIDHIDSKDKAGFDKKAGFNHKKVDWKKVNWQRVAALNCLSGSVHLIVGGPGTGKTFTVTRILALLQSISHEALTIRLSAPTGKAAQRLAESIRQAKSSLTEVDVSLIPDHAETLHRLLGVIRDSLHFRHNEDNPIDADVLVVDEVSMVDLPMMARLLRAIKPSTRVIFLGDADQLPSVAAGSVLADLSARPHPGYSESHLAGLKAVDGSIDLPLATHNACDYLTELKTSRRFAQDSGIGLLAQRVIEGQLESSVQAFSQFDDLCWHAPSELQNQLATSIRLYFGRIGQQASLMDAFAMLRRFRILCAVREGEYGVVTINRRIEQKLNPQRRPFYHGQPIMVTRNHYGLKLFNGDMGIVWANRQQTLMAWFETEGEPRPVALGRLPQVETVYAMTIHKTQGSEFEDVLLLLPRQPTPILTRQLLFTGLTRAKKSFACLGSQRVWQTGVKANVERWAGLSGRLQK